MKCVRRCFSWSLSGVLLSINIIFLLVSDIHEQIPLRQRDPEKPGIHSNCSPYFYTSSSYTLQELQNLLMYCKALEVQSYMEVTQWISKKVRGGNMAL